MNFIKIIMPLRNIGYLLILSLLLSPIFPQADKNQPVESKKETSEGDITETKLVPIADKPEWKLGFYGFVKTDYVYSNHSVLSYGRENLVAPNQAKRYVQRGSEHARSNIQLGDTRLGFKSEYGKLLAAVIEMDFIDFDKSSPNVNVRPRLRQAYISINLTPQWEIFAGQKWDIFSPLNPDTYNIINNLFYQGNVGWIREQFGTTYKFTKELQFSMAIGNSSVNTNASPSISLEKNKNPTLAGQMKWTPNSQNTVFLSGIRTTRTYHDPDMDPVYIEGKSLIYDGSEDSYIVGSQIGKTNRIRKNAIGVALGSEFKSSNGQFVLKWETNWGKNLSDLNVLGIGQAQVISLDNHFLSSPAGMFTQTSPDSYLSSLRKYNQSRIEVLSIEEKGAWISGIYKFYSQWELGLFMGITQIINRNHLSPAFSDSKKGIFRDFSKEQADPANGIWNSNLTGRIRENGGIGYHLTYLFENRLKMFFQHEYIRTFYQDPVRYKGIMAHIKSIDLDTGVITLRDVKPAYHFASAMANAHVFRIGVMLSF